MYQMHLHIAMCILYKDIYYYSFPYTVMSCTLSYMSCVLYMFYVSCVSAFCNVCTVQGLQLSISLQELYTVKCLYVTYKELEQSNKFNAINSDDIHYKNNNKKNQGPTDFALWLIGGPWNSLWQPWMYRTSQLLLNILFVYLYKRNSSNILLNEYTKWMNIQNNNDLNCDLKLDDTLSLYDLHSVIEVNLRSGLKLGWMVWGCIRAGSCHPVPPMWLLF